MSNIIGRPTKQTEGTADLILEALRAGNSRKASAGYAKVSYSTFKRMLEDPEFAEQVELAEAEAELVCGAVIQQAARPHDVVEHVRTEKTVFKNRKVRHPDGTVVEEPIPLQETTETLRTRREVNVPAAMWWLERRRSGDWRPVKEIRVEDLTDDQLLSLLDELAEDEGPGAAEAGGPTEGDPA